MIRIQIDDQKVRAELRKLSGRLGNMAPFYKNVGEELVESTKERFNEQLDPEGKPWRPLKPATMARKKTKRILRERGLLQDTIFYRASGRELLVGSARIYSAIHQLGGTVHVPAMKPKNKKALFWPGAAHPVKSVKAHDVRIPARPYLGVSERDRVRILEIAGDFLAKA
jgi:phage virion morphogenesis protein